MWQRVFESSSGAGAVPLPRDVTLRSVGNGFQAASLKRSEAGSTTGAPLTVEVRGNVMWCSQAGAVIENAAGGRRGHW
jgi:hypothetical protein